MINDTIKRVKNIHYFYHVHNYENKRFSLTNNLTYIGIIIIRSL